MRAWADRAPWQARRRAPARRSGQNRREERGDGVITPSGYGPLAASMLRAPSIPAPPRGFHASNLIGCFAVPSALVVVGVAQLSGARYTIISLALCSAGCLGRWLAGRLAFLRSGGSWLNIRVHFAATHA